MTAAFVMGSLISALFAPGYLSVDEVTYHLMVKNLADGRLFEVLNGYHEFPSEAFLSASLQVHDGRLVGMPPPGYPLLAAPFYWLFGYRALFLLNSLAFCGTLLLTYDIARRQSGDHTQSLLACFLLAAASFLGDYAVAAWPHALTCLLLLSSFWLLLRGDAFTATDSVPDGRMMSASGLVLGIAVTVRYDAIFLLPVLLMPLLVKRPFNIRPIALLMAGLVPVLLLLALANRSRFGELTPFSYGDQVGRAIALDYLPLLMLALVSLIALAAWPGRRFGNLLLVAAGTGLLALLVSSTVRGMTWQWANGAYQLLVDFRIRDLSIEEPALSRGPGGSMLYLGAVKKSLLQSLPWLPLILVPLARLLRSRSGQFDLLMLTCFLPLLSFFMPYAYLAWHGGLALNLRYFTPLLPFVAILAASGWVNLFPLRAGTPLPRTTLMLGIGTILLVGMASLWLQQGIVAAGTAGEATRLADLLALQELMFLSLPLVLAIGLTVLILLCSSNLIPLFASRSCWMALTITVCWSFGVTYTYDLLRAGTMRNSNYDNAAVAAEWVENDALVITTFPDAFFGLMEHGNVRIADPSSNEFADFNAMARFYISRGVAVYTAVDRQLWEGLDDMVMTGLEATPIVATPDYVLRQLTVTSAR